MDSGVHVFQDSEQDRAPGGVRAQLLGDFARPESQNRTAGGGPVTAVPGQIAAFFRGEVHKWARVERDVRLPA